MWFLPVDITSDSNALLCLSFILFISVQRHAQWIQPQGYIFLTTAADKRKIHIRPYVTPASAAQSSTFFTSILHLLIFSFSLWIKLSILLTDNNASPLNLCSSNLTARGTICIFLCRPSAICLEAGGEGICRHLICLGLVGKTMGFFGVMCDFLFLSEPPGVMLCGFLFSLEKPLEAKPTYSSMCEHAFFSNPLPFIGWKN